MNVSKYRRVQSRVPCVTEYNITQDLGDIFACAQIDFILDNNIVDCSSSSVYKAHRVTRARPLERSQICTKNVHAPTQTNTHAHTHTDQRAHHALTQPQHTRRNEASRRRRRRFSVTNQRHSISSTSPPSSPQRPTRFAAAACPIVRTSSRTGRAACDETAKNATTVACLLPSVRRACVHASPAVGFRVSIHRSVPSTPCDAQCRAECVCLRACGARGDECLCPACLYQSCDVDVATECACVSSSSSATAFCLRVSSLGV